MKATIFKLFRRNQKNEQGISLIELIVTIVLIGLAVSIITVSLSTLSDMGGETQNIKYAQFAQQRLELILAEKLKVGFPDSCGGPDPCKGPDPCDLYAGSFSEPIPGCDDVVHVEFVNDAGNDTCENNGLDYCNATVTVDDFDLSYTIKLYNFE